MRKLLATLGLLTALLVAAVAQPQPEVKWETTIKGEGAPIKMGDTVSIEYTLKLADGTMIDSSPSDGSYDLELGSSKVIRGLSLGMVGMKRGETRLITVPPDLGYGPQAAGPIPGNSTLYFEVRLLYRLAHQHGDDESGDHDHEHHDQASENALAATEDHDHGSQYGEDGSTNRPNAQSVDRPAIFEYLLRDFFTRPWRNADAATRLWQGNGWLTLIVAVVFLLGHLLGRRGARP